MNVLSFYQDQLKMLNSQNINCIRVQKTCQTNFISDMCFQEIGKKKDYILGRIKRINFKSVIA